MHYEGEIGIVIGARLRNASEEEAVAGIRGLVAVNDVTARDLQRRDSQWTRAKGFDTRRSSREKRVFASWTFTLLISSILD